MVYCQKFLLMDKNNFNDRLRQIALLLIIISIFLVLLSELRLFFPGFLGAITLYILSRNHFFRWTDRFQWKKGLSALLFIFIFLILFAIPLYLAVALISPKISAIADQQEKLLEGIRIIAQRVKQSTGFELITSDNVSSIAKQLSSLIPQLLNGTAMMLAMASMAPAAPRR